MPRRPTPWRRGGKDGPWYAQVGGRKVWLAAPEATRTEAREALDAIWAEHRKAKREGAKLRLSGLTLTDVVNLFIAHAEQEVARNGMAPLTLEGYVRFLVPLEQAMGKTSVSSLKASQVEAWLTTAGDWGPTTRNNAITALKACLNWARRSGHIPENPLRDMAKPQARVTEEDMTPELARRILESIRDRPFKDLLAVSWGTGARPSEMMRLEARHLKLDEGRATLEGKTTRATGRLRTIFLTDDVVPILRRLAEVHPTGPLFRNRLGRPWTRNAVAWRFSRLRTRYGLGKAATAKGLRHGFATDALEREVPIATVAELMGHKSTKMLERHYSKLSKRTEHLREAARKVRPGDGSG